VARAGEAMVGFGVDARAVIHGSGATRPDALARLRAEFRPVAEAMTPLEETIGRGLSGLGALEVELVRRESTLLSTWVVSSAGKPTTSGAPFELPRTGTRRATAEPKAARCLADAGQSIAQALRALSTVTPETLGAITSKGLTDARPNLECAAQNADTRDAAAALRRLHVMLATDLMVEKGAPRSAALVLAAECEAASDPTICARHQTLDSLPSPTLPRIALPAQCGLRWELPEPSARISIDDRGIGMLDELVTATSLASRMPKRQPDNRAPSAPVELTVDRETTMRSVRPVLEALRGAGLQEVLISVRDGEERRSLPVSVLDRAGKEEDDWVALELDGTGLTVHTSTGARTQTPVEEGRDPMELRTRLPRDAAVFVHASDDAAWRDLTALLAAGCPHATLTLRPGLPTP